MAGHLIVRADAEHLPFPDASMDIVIGSPPYIDARLYLEDGRDLGISRDLDAWVAWMLDVTAEALRVSKGLVVWVCAGVTRDRTYQPGPEALLADWVRRGGSAYRPVYWHRVGIPGSGGDDWFRFDVEYCLAFKRPGKLPWADCTANGWDAVCGPGGAMANRTRKGDRIVGRVINMTTRRGRTGDREGARDYPCHDRYKDEGLKVNPGTLLSTGAGGSANLGHALAHDNEAPYPIDVPAWFISSHAPPGGLVLDPFLGSGTTLQAAAELGRVGVGCDLRASQCDLARRRLGTVTPALPGIFA